MTIKLLGLKIKEQKLTAPEPAFDKDNGKFVYTDATGKRVKKVCQQASKYVWVYEDGSPYEGEEYKTIKGTPVSKLEKTTEIKNEEIKPFPLNKLGEFLINPYSFYLINAELKQLMKAKAINREGIIFPFTVSKGMKNYFSVVYYHPLHDKVLMRCFQGSLKNTVMNEDGLEQVSNAPKPQKISINHLEV